MGTQEDEIIIVQYTSGITYNPVGITHIYVDR